MAEKSARITSIPESRLRLAQLIAAGLVARVIVEDGTNTYICINLNADADLADDDWMIQKIDDSGSNFFANGKMTFNSVATAPASLTYPSRS